MKAKITRKFHVLFWDGGWQNARGPYRDKLSAIAAAKAFARRYPHLKPITIIRDTISIVTIAKIR